MKCPFKSVNVCSTYYIIIMTVTWLCSSTGCLRKEYVVADLMYLKNDNTQQCNIFRHYVITFMELNCHTGMKSCRPIQYLITSCRAEIYRYEWWGQGGNVPNLGSTIHRGIDHLGCRIDLAEWWCCWTHIWHISFLTLPPAKGNISALKLAMVTKWGSM